MMSRRLWAGRHGAQPDLKAKSVVRRNARGTSALLQMGGLLLASLLGVFSIDLPLYFSTQNQLQTAVNAAALAGASQLPYGEEAAVSAAEKYAALNEVAGKALSPDALNVDFLDTNTLTMEVSAEAEAPTLLGQVLRALVCDRPNSNVDPENNSDQDSATPEIGGGVCAATHLYASARAVPAARDTVLVIDNSSSMTSLGNGQPLGYVKNAAEAFVDKVVSMNRDSVDRIALVRFAFDGTSVQGLRSQEQDPGFSTLKSRIRAISAYSAKGWNTNYEAGLRLALDELEKNGRPNANKMVLFFTDGLPNLPGPGGVPGSFGTPDTNSLGRLTWIDAPDELTPIPDNAYKLINFYNNPNNNTTRLDVTNNNNNRDPDAAFKPYNTCLNPLHDSNPVKALCRVKKDKFGNTVYNNGLPVYENCPEMPSSRITDAMILTQDVNCGIAYTTFMENAVKWQIQRAVTMGATLHTVEIYEAGVSDNAHQVLRRLTKRSQWDPNLLEAMTEATDGQSYASVNYDRTAILRNFETVAKDIRMKLTE